MGICGSTGKYDKYNNNINKENNLNTRTIKSLTANEMAKHEILNLNVKNLNSMNFSQSYINAVLQCFCNITEFVNYFKYGKGKEILLNDNQNEKLCKTFKILIDNFYPDNPKELKRTSTPVDLLYNISHINPLFKDISTNNEKDLINFIIMTLHEELNEHSPKNNNIEESNTGNIFEDQKDKKIMSNKFTSYFKQSHVSIISDLFFAINYSKNQCLNCKAITYNFQIYSYLYISLEEVINFKSMKNNQINAIDLLDCFDFATKENIMSGDNAMYCNYCKKIFQSSMSTVLYTAPEILIIILNRESDIKINFNYDLNIANYIEINNKSCQYELIGIVSKNNVGNKDDFIAYCKGYLNNKWMKFCDTLTEPVKDIKSEVIDTSIPYLFFYKKIKK